MPQAEQTRLRRFIALFLGASLLFGFALEQLNRHPGPEHERWSLAPGYGLAVTLPQVGELLDKLEITDGALELPARWLELLPAPAYVIANSFLKSLATDLVLDTSQALELGFRDLSASDRVRYAVIGTKNSELAASNLLTLAQAERVAPQAARLGAGPLAGQMMVWAERPRQLALAIGPTRALAQRVIQQFRAVEGRQRSDLRWVYRHHPALDPSFVQRLDLEGEIRRDGIRLSGAAQGDLPPTPRFRSKDEVLLAIAGPWRAQAQWLRASADSGRCQRGLQPALQAQLQVRQACAAPPPAGTYIRVTGRVFKQLDLPWTKAELTVTAGAPERLISGFAKASSDQPYFALYRMVGRLLRRDP